MKEYYEILDVPLTATPEQIKAQYRQLVRVYHPDRFRNQDDKAYAEEKLKEINIAFQVLSGTSVRREPFEARVAPQPVAYPPQLDFGTLQIGQRAKLKLQIGNLGGPAENVDYGYSCPKPWFQLSKGKRVYPEQPFPIDFEVAVETRRLKAEQSYREWVEVVLDGMPVRVEVLVRTVAHRRVLLGPVRWQWSVAGFSLLFAGLLLASFMHVSLPSLPSLPTDVLPGALLSAHPSYELRAEEMLFSVNEGSETALYVGLGEGSTPRRLGLSGEEAVGTQAGQHIAYLHEIENLQQIFLFDLAKGDTRQLTYSSGPKARLAWSSDGLRLGYLVGQGDERRIGIYDLRAAQEYLLPGASSSGVEHFAWSPDGQSLLFDLWQGDEQRVYRMGVHGDDLRQLTHFDSWAGAWSADGTQILVGTDEGLYRLSSNGQQLHQLTTVPAYAFSWSADGQWIAYTTVTGAATAAQASAEEISYLPQTLWLTDRFGKESRQIAENLLWHQWSPDGATIGYVTGNVTTPDSLLYLWTLAADGQASAVPSLVAEVNRPFFSWPR
ncbi:MAG: DnaJ domain-containing protein [Caldilineaceae bacterium]|nr:DnaJ domain-containing protein [Caldilineaceae bacterium]